MSPEEKACLQDGNKARMYEAKKKEQKAKEEQNRKNKVNTIFRLKDLIMKCRQRGKWNLAIKLNNKLINFGKEENEENNTNSNVRDVINWLC
tara:strand:+ start:219 stop:494 length:276 start_codon:yes stop_codon:yes gene_type:complete